MINDQWSVQWLILGFNALLTWRNKLVLFIYLLLLENGQVVCVWLSVFHTFISLTLGQNTQLDYN